MRRRDFLVRAAAAVAGAMVLDPERLLWTPGQRTYFIPPAPTVERILDGDFVYFTETQKRFLTDDGRVFVYVNGARRVSPQAKGMIGVMADPATGLVQTYGVVNNLFLDNRFRT